MCLRLWELRPLCQGGLCGFHAFRLATGCRSDSSCNNTPICFCGFAGRPPSRKPCVILSAKSESGPETAKLPLLDRSDLRLVPLSLAPVLVPQPLDEQGLQVTEPPLGTRQRRRAAGTQASKHTIKLATQTLADRRMLPGKRFGCNSLQACPASTSLSSPLCKHLTQRRKR